MTMTVSNDSLRQQLQAGADALALGLSDAQVSPVSYTHLTLPTIYSV